MNRRNFLRGALATAALTFYGPRAVAPKVKAQPRAIMIHTPTTATRYVMLSGLGTGMTEMRKYLHIYREIPNVYGIPPDLLGIERDDYNTHPGPPSGLHHHPDSRHS